MHGASITQARTERRRLQAEGRKTVAPDAGSLHALAGRWLAQGEQRWSPGTFATRESSYRLRVFPEYGRSPVVSIEHRAVEAWAARLLAEGHGRRAVTTALETLHAMLATAVEAAAISANPAARVRLPPAPPRERTAADRVLDHQQKARLIAACRKLRHEVIVRLAVEAGLRRGEICGLAWPDVLEAERRLVIRASVHRDARVGTVLKSTKTGRVERVAITPVLAGRLATLRADATDAEGFVVPGQKPGTPLVPTTVSRLISTLCYRAGLVDAKGRPIVHLHGLRHSAGSLALAEGVPLPVVARQLRHSNPRITAAVYSHVINEAELDRFAAAHAERGSTDPD